jgi:hypothetical protein
MWEGQKGVLLLPLGVSSNHIPKIAASFYEYDDCVSSNIEMSFHNSAFLAKKYRIAVAGGRQ